MVEEGAGSHALPAELNFVLTKYIYDVISAQFFNIDGTNVQEAKGSLYGDRYELDIMTTDPETEKTRKLCGLWVTKAELLGALAEVEKTSG